MLILHLSDLHRTGKASGPNSGIGPLWVAVRAALDRQGISSFDFVVVSGDLTQGATRAEYSELLTFTNQKLVPLVGNERRRVIFIPGNHDVDWKANVVSPVPLSRVRDDDFPAIEKAFKDFRRSPETSGHRVAIGRYGHLDLFKINNNLYSQRFQEVQNFLDRFYSSSLQGRFQKRFNLTANPQRGLDWSAHIFPEDGVAFFGLNSCHLNDAYWHGAHFNPFAIEGIHGRIQKLKAAHPDILLIAVWHHGLVSERGRPDRLTMEEVGDLMNLDFKIGFHGHTHKDDKKIVDLVRDRFTIIGTGSIGAGKEERGGAVPNQFSTVELLARRSVRTTVFEKINEDVGHYDPRPPTLSDLRLKEIDRFAAHNSVITHSRHWTVGKDGLSSVDVTMSGLKIVSDVKLGTIVPPFGNTMRNDVATLDGAPIPVRRELLKDGSQKYVAVAPVGQFDSLRWNYVFSNALALTQTDLEHLLPRSAFFPSITSNREFRGHYVTAETGTLVLRLKLPNGFRLTDPEAVVEKRIESHHEEKWERMTSEEARCSVTSSAANVELTIDTPLVGVRYGISFVPDVKGRPIPLTAKNLAGRLERECRDTVHPAAGVSSLSSAFTYATLSLLGEISALGLSDNWIETAINDEQDDAGMLLAKDESWLGYIWNAPRRELRPIFGQFPARSWARAFVGCNGVVGHAFRFGTPVAWVKENDDPSACIFEPTTTGETNYAWLLAIPLLLAQEGPSIGVVSFGGTGANERSDRLGDLARYMVGRGRKTNRVSKSRQQDRFHSDLVQKVNAAFWGLIADGRRFTTGRLLPADRRYAKIVSKALEA